MIPKTELFDEIIKFCFEKKIVFEMETQGEMNATSFRKVDNKNVFTITIANNKDKNLNKIISEGFNSLKKFFE